MWQSVSIRWHCPNSEHLRGGQREPKVIVIDDTYGYEENSRAYHNYCPALRSERSGLKVMNDMEYKIDADGILHLSYDITKTDNDNQNENVDFSDVPYRIRKLTPKECWRLMGFSDGDFTKAKSALNEKCYKGKDKSSSQLYKQAGNSIVVDVLYYIFKQLYDVMPYLFDDLKVSSYFSGIGAFECGLDRLFEDINNKDVPTTE